LALSEDPLRRALRESDLATIQRDPSVVNTTDEHGNTPLHRAAQAEDTADSAEFMNFLLDHGTALDVPNHLGFTPVYVTLIRNHAYNARDAFFRSTPQTWAVVVRTWCSFSSPTTPPSSSRTTSPGRRRVFGPSTLKSRRLCRRWRTRDTRFF
jgi:hypothetical protein